MKTPSSYSLVLRGGSLTAQRWSIVLAIYLITLIIALPIAAAFRSSLIAVLGDGSAMSRMFSDFDYTVYDDFMRNSNHIVEVFTRMIFPIVLMSTIIHGLLAAGVASAIKGDATVGGFLRGTGVYLGRSAKLLSLFLILTVLVIGIWSIGLGFIWSAMTAGNVTESAYLWASIVVAGLFLIPIAVLSLALEYARIIMVRDELTGAFKAMGKGLAFVGQHPIRMIAMHGTLVLLMLAFIALYWLLEGFIGMTSVAGIVLVFILQQLSVVARVAVRAWHTASGVELASSLAEEPGSVAVMTSAPAEAAPAPAPASAPVIAAAPAVTVKRATRKVVRKPAAPRRPAVKKVVRKKK